MKKTLPSSAFAIAGVAYLAACSVQAQQRGQSNQQGNDITTYSIYVTGSVVRPIELHPRGPLTLTQGINLAGGVTSDAKTKNVMILRQENGEIRQIIITVDLKAVRKHHAEDPVLRPYDIVDVPSKHRGCIKANPCPATTASDATK